MTTVAYSNKEDMCSLVMDGEEYVEDEERAIIPKAVLKQTMPKKKLCRSL